MKTQYRPIARVSGPTVAALSLVLTLSACGGGDDNADNNAKKSSPTASASQPESSTSPAKKVSSGGELVAGEKATATVEEEDGTVTYDIAVTKVDVGTEADTAKLPLDDEDRADVKGLVPATAYVTYTHKSGPTLTNSSDAGDSTTIWAGGRPGTNLIFAPEDAAGCEDPYDVESWKSGESHTFCETYLVAAKPTSLEVHWTEEVDGKEGEPYIWKGLSK